MPLPKIILLSKFFPPRAMQLAETTYYKATYVSEGFLIQDGVGTTDPAEYRGEGLPLENFVEPEE